MSEYRIIIFNPVTGEDIYHFLTDDSIQQDAKTNMRRNLENKTELTKFPAGVEYVAKLQKKIYNEWKDVRSESFSFHIKEGIVVIQ